MFDSTIDYSFAIWAPRRTNCHHPPSCLRTACYDDPCNNSCGYGNSTSSSSETFSRSVTFAESVVSEVRSVCVDLVSRGRGPFVERPDYRVPRLVPPPP